jgi:hypothetical protein
VAAYAAIVSTLTGTMQLLNSRRDRARIRLFVQRNMQIIGDPHPGTEAPYRGEVPYSGQMQVEGENAGKK